jgi:G3E family GTPase
MVSITTTTKKKVPVTILTGFLGSGKTTLLNHILTEQHGMRFAIIENEFGEVGVDDMLLKQQKQLLDRAEEEIVEMNNGCICCTVRGDLIRIIKEILERVEKESKESNTTAKKNKKKKRPLDGIIIETTGLADPAPVAQTFFVDDFIAQNCHLDGIITVVDAKFILQRLDEKKPEGVENESVEQVAFADRILLNKTDLVENIQLEAIKDKIRSINATVDIIECQYSRVEPEKLLNINSFDLQAILKKEPDFLDDSKEHLHDTSVTSVGVTVDKPVNLAQFQNWMQSLLMEKGNDLLRFKGVISVKGMEKMFVFQGVHMLFDGGFAKSAECTDKRSRFVFIGKNLDRELLTKGFHECCVTNPLRFQVGDKILAHVEEGYLPGKIIAQWDEGNPYRIRLDRKSEEIWAPIDEDIYVRAPSQAVQ